MVVKPNSIDNDFFQTFGKLGLGDEASNRALITSKGTKAVFYGDSGVDTDTGDDFSSFAGKVCRASYENSKFLVISDLSKGNFRGPRGFTAVNLPDGCVDTLAPDGIGTKVILLDTIGSLVGGASDVVAMTGDDIVRYGGVPVAFTSVLDVSSIDPMDAEYREMMMNLGQIAHNQGFVILNGETAELGKCVGSTNLIAKTSFNWSGMMSGKYHPDKMILGDKVKAGDILVALKQDGFRSNGLSAVRRAFELEYGDNYYEDAPRSELIEAATPSIPYARGIAEANGWYSPGFKAPVEMTGIAHLSGGSFKGKLLEDMLGLSGLSAKFDNLYPIPEIAKKVALWSQKAEKPIEDIEELYSTFCLGQGMIVAIRPDGGVDNFIEIMGLNGIDAQVAGTVIETPEGKDPSIEISNIK